MLQEMNMFVQSTYDLDTLVKVQIPSSAQLMQKMRGRSGSLAPGRVQMSSSQPLIPQSSLLHIDELYRDRKPQLPMHRAVNYASLRDPVHRHGAQTLEMRTAEKKGKPTDTRNCRSCLDSEMIVQLWLRWCLPIPKFVRESIKTACLFYVTHSIIDNSCWSIVTKFPGLVHNGHATKQLYLGHICIFKYKHHINIAKYAQSDTDKM